MTTAETLINRLPEIITAIGVVVTAIGSVLAAYWSYKGKQQSIANGVAVSAIDTNVQKTLARQSVIE
jgi:hypothetical protein